MRDPLARYEPGISFWKVMPQLADVMPFRVLYEDDASEKKQHSSLVMWWVVRCFHLSMLNDLRDKLREERMNAVSEALFRDVKWHKDKKRAKMLEGFEKAWATMKPLSLRNLETAELSMEVRNEYLASLIKTSKLYKENAVEIEKMNSGTPKLLANIRELKAAVRLDMGEEDEEEDEDSSALESDLL